MIFAAFLLCHPKCLCIHAPGKRKRILDIIKVSNQRERKKCQRRKKTALLNENISGDIILPMIAKQVTRQGAEDINWCCNSNTPCTKHAITFLFYRVIDCIAGRGAPHSQLQLIWCFQNFIRAVMGQGGGVPLVTFAEGNIMCSFSCSLFLERWTDNRILLCQYLLGVLIFSYELHDSAQQFLLYIQLLVTHSCGCVGGFKLQAILQLQTIQAGLSSYLRIPFFRVVCL